MTNHKKPTIKIETALMSDGPRHALVAAAAAAILRNGEPPSREEQHIGRQARIRGTEQIARFVLIDQSGHLSQKFGERTAQRIHEITAYYRTVRERERHPDDDANVDYALNILYESQVNTQVALTVGLDDELLQIARTPFGKPPAGEKHIVEEYPGLLGWLVGGRKVTRVIEE